jgi:hypothetical protein
MRNLNLKKLIRREYLEAKKIKKLNKTYYLSNYYLIKMVIIKNILLNSSLRSIM